MNNYMVVTLLPKTITEEFINLIPKQRALINKLMDEGKVLQYSLAMDRSVLWITMNADSEQQVLDLLSTFPLIDYMNPTVYELAFHNSISNELPKLIMN